MYSGASGTIVSRRNSRLWRWRRKEKRDKDAKAVAHRSPWACCQYLSGGAVLAWAPVPSPDAPCSIVLRLLVLLLTTPASWSFVVTTRLFVVTWKANVTIIVDGWRWHWKVKRRDSVIAAASKRSVRYLLFFFTADCNFSGWCRLFSSADRLVNRWLILRCCPESFS